jgi:hypothetical protein
VLSPSPTLCLPDRQKSCFACCPPIRPAGYEHLQYKNINKRILRENTAAFLRGERTIVPITGFSCWALGYLDENYRLVGCLLHPSQNDGLDLRYRVNYATKCQRESCRQAQTFSELDLSVKRFWLHLADGLDSFSYSSRRTNFLFRMIDWGTHLLKVISVTESSRILTTESFLTDYAFFSTSLSPRAHAYLLNRLIKAENVDLLKSTLFRAEFEHLAASLAEEIAHNQVLQPEGSPVHRLPLDQRFLDYLRLSLDARRMNEQEAMTTKDEVDARIEKWRRAFTNPPSNS